MKSATLKLSVDLYEVVSTSLPGADDWRPSDPIIPIPVQTTEIK